MPIRIILVIATDEVVRSDLQRILAGAQGPEVLLASSAADGLQRAEISVPDVILLEPTLSGMDGPTFLAQLRKQEQTARIPVIVVTPAGSPVLTPHQARALGFAGAIAKPFDPQGLPGQVQSDVEEARLALQFAYLHELGGEEFIREMIDLYLELAPTQIEAAQRGMQAGDLDAVRKAIHSLKSGSANLGAHTVDNLAVRIEGQAAEGQAIGLPGLLAELEEAFARARSRMEQRKQEDATNS